jgi:hypothetical protein
MMKAMGISNTYVYSSDMGVEANKINDEMMREILSQNKQHAPADKADEAQ